MPYVAVRILLPEKLFGWRLNVNDDNMKFDLVENLFLFGGGTHYFLTFELIRLTRETARNSLI